MTDSRWKVKTASEKCKRWREKHPEYSQTPEFKLKALNRGLKYKYNGFDLEAKRVLFLKQNGKCPICTLDLPYYTSPKCAVDHNHITNEVRGLLHLGCNVWVGFVEKHSETVLSRIQQYLNQTSNN